MQTLNWSMQPSQEEIVQKTLVPPIQLALTGLLSICLPCYPPTPPPPQIGRRLKMLVVHPSPKMKPPYPEKHKLFELILALLIG
jgi:hypothetical protein